MELSTERTTDIGNRPATILRNGLVRVVVDDKGGMVPELSYPRGRGWANAHWTPPFRSNSGLPYDPAKHGDFWPVELLYEIAGNFPCFPSFGSPGEAYGIDMPPHGITANGLWKHIDHGTIPGKAAYLKSSLEPDSNYPGIPLVFTKYDILISDHPVHYTYMRIENRGQQTYNVNGAWHNNVGAPFLSAGCLIDLSARRFLTPPPDGEFDDTGRLKKEAEFDDFEAAPLRDGGTANLRQVPGIIGYSDFITGAVPKDSPLGWCSVVNPAMEAVYLTFFKGPASIEPSGSELPLYFNDLWMQYGGRPFPPWAGQPGGTDVTFCLGTENAVGAYANGLAYSLENPELLGHPTTVAIAPGEKKTHFYGTMITAYESGRLAGGIESVSPERDGISLVGRSRTGSGVQKITADPLFESIPTHVAEIG